MKVLERLFEAIRARDRRKVWEITRTEPDYREAALVAADAISGFRRISSAGELVDACPGTDPEAKDPPGLVEPYGNLPPV